MKMIVVHSHSKTYIWLQWLKITRKEVSIQCFQYFVRYCLFKKFLPTSRSQNFNNSNKAGFFKGSFFSWRKGEGGWGQFDLPFTFQEELI